MIPTLAETRVAAPGTIRRSRFCRRIERSAWWRNDLRIDPRELLAAIERGTAPVVLDVRSRTEFASGRVPGALHVPFWLVASKVPALALNPGTPLVVYCGHGPRAYLAGAALRRLGFRRITYLAGHMARWTREGLPTEPHGTDDRTRP
jgi:rhodanese-related sulfurtransferase